MTNAARTAADDLGSPVGLTAHRVRRRQSQFFYPIRQDGIKRLCPATQPVLVSHGRHRIRDLHQAKVVSRAAAIIEVLRPRYRRRPLLLMVGWTIRQMRLRERLTCSLYPVKIRFSEPESTCPFE